MKPEKSLNLNALYNIINDRKKTQPKNSYITSLFQQGRDRILQKVGEEAVEVVIAGKNDSKKELISEMADLWFHSLVLLAICNIQFSEVLEELEKRAKKK